MHRRAFTTSIAALLIGVLTPLAAAVPVTIDFGNFVDADFDPGETYTEDGFTFTVISGDEWGIFSNAGNGPSGLGVGALAANAPGTHISIKPTLGGFFTFDAFDFASFDTAQSDTVNLVGLVGGIQTEILPNVGSNTTMFTVAANPGFVNPIDELRIVAAAGGLTSLELDNFVFNSVNAAIVPEPATATLGLLTLAGLALRRRRAA